MGAWRPAAGRAQQELVASVARLQREWRERLAAPRHGARRLRSNATAWRVLDLLPRLLVLTGPVVANELAIPLKSASAALRDLVDAGVLVEHGTVQRAGRSLDGVAFAPPRDLRPYDADGFGRTMGSELDGA